MRKQVELAQEEHQRKKAKYVDERDQISIKEEEGNLGVGGAIDGLFEERFDTDQSRSEVVEEILHQKLRDTLRMASLLYHIGEKHDNIVRVSTIVTENNQ